jgi:hypothetical protein
VDAGVLEDAEVAYDRRMFGEFAFDGIALCALRTGRHAEAADAYARAEALSADPQPYRRKRELAESRAAASA